MKKIRTKILLAFAASGLLLLPSCGDWLDINTNELASTKVEPGYLFNYAAVNYSGTRMGGDQYMSIAWPAQVISDGDYWYGGDDFYTISTYSTGNTWVSTYASVGNNLMKAIDFAKEAGDTNAEAQCKILFTISVWGSTMIFGDIPYSEAWRIEEIKTPKFDPQKDILYALVDLVDEALGLIDTSKESSITSYDIYYKGDMEKWLKLGKSLKLRLLLYLANHEDVGAQIAALVTEDKMLASNADTFAFPYFDTAGNYNPNYALYEVYPNLTPIWNAANPTVIDPMLAVDDPRIPFYFDPAETDENLYAGIPAGKDYFENPTGADPFPGNEWLDKDGNLKISLLNLDFYCQPDTPDVLFSYAELEQYIAEVYVRGLGVSKNKATANTHYRAAIKASCINAGVAEADAETFVTGLKSLADMSDDEALEAIANQQRIDMMIRPLEAWSEQRRTGYPVLSVPSRLASMYPGVINRWPYAERETLVNGNAPQVDGVWTKMWFQK